MKPFAESCEQNKQPILQVLKHYLGDVETLLEIGSGTGQHAVFFAGQFPHLDWICSDREENHTGINAWLADADAQNLQGPLLLDVEQSQWPVDKVDAVFSANTVHIMGWPSVVKMFEGIGRVLAKRGVFCLYGPFNYNGEFTSDSNARFDLWLKDRDPVSGVRDFEALQQLAEQAGMVLVHDHAMPANNRILAWQKI